jgi:hypothetical protein
MLVGVSDRSKTVIITKKTSKKKSNKHSNISNPDESEIHIYILFSANLQKNVNQVANRNMCSFVRNLSFRSLGERTWFMMWNLKFESEHVWFFNSFACRFHQRNLRTFFLGSGGKFWTIPKKNCYVITWQCFVANNFRLICKYRIFVFQYLSILFILWRSFKFM